MGTKSTAYKADYNKQHYAQIAVRLPEKERQLIQKAAASAGMSIREWMVSMAKKETQPD